MMQELLVGILFVSAIGYLIIVLTKHTKGDSGCASGCSACDGIDLKEIETKFKEKEEFIKASTNSL